MYDVCKRFGLMPENKTWLSTEKKKAIKHIQQDEVKREEGQRTRNLP